MLVCFRQFRQKVTHMCAGTLPDHIVRRNSVNPDAVIRWDYLPFLDNDGLIGRIGLVHQDATELGGYGTCIITDTMVVWDVPTFEYTVGTIVRVVQRGGKHVVEPVISN